MLRVLITRLSAVGDCIHTMPLVHALRRKYPAAFIAWVTQPGPATLLEEYPGLNQVIVVRRDWWKSLSSIQNIRRQLRSLKFDVAIDPQGLTKSSALGWLSDANQRIGFTGPQGRELSVWLNTELVEPTVEHVVDRYLQLLSPLLGSDTIEARFELPIKSHETVERFLQQARFGSHFAILNPGAGWDSKIWPANRFGQLAKYLGNQHQMPSVVVWAGDRERRWAELIVAESGGHAWLAPSTTLPELATLMHRADFCVAADTGPLHLAAAVGTRCIGLYGTTRPAISGPYGNGHLTVQAFYQDGTSRQRRTASNTAMRAIDVPTVAQACDQMLSQLRTPQAA